MLSAKALAAVILLCLVTRGWAASSLGEDSARAGLQQQRTLGSEAEGKPSTFDTAMQEQLVHLAAALQTQGGGGSLAEAMQAQRAKMHEAQQQQQQQAAQAAAAEQAASVNVALSQTSIFQHVAQLKEYVDRLRTPFMQFAGKAKTLEDVLQNATAFDAFVVVVASAGAPSRRNQLQPFLSLSPSSCNFSALHFQSALNKGAEAVEAVLGRRLFPFRLQARALGSNGSTWTPPYAVYDFSTGDVFIEPALIEGIGMADSSVVASFAEAVADRLPALASGIGHSPADLRPHSVVQDLALWVPIALASAFALATPLWFCITCPIVLGMLAPFAFNFGLGEVAQLLCDTYSLPVDECNELWLGAFALALVLSLASTVPIVYLCRLPQCGKSLLSL